MILNLTPLDNLTFLKKIGFNIFSSFIVFVTGFYLVLKGYGSHEGQGSNIYDLYFYIVAGVLLIIIIYSMILMYRRYLDTVSQVNFKFMLLKVLMTYIAIVLAIAIFLGGNSDSAFLGLVNSLWVTFTILFTYLSFKKSSKEMDVNKV